ncbi:UDP-N-acetylmuramoyl-tripeptide--D-alanyl-D-alanine ligase [candidate division WOR-3 bacterium]|uniref:UDP-N-acetylmuramoyl-tripeptide--D-alanyl-D-alanine ligase n=1 Tax=candidate division WOR-3 bacterium TaxID=2052148 RepID=A0A937XCE3_UNCW3|nr:UDP-N-acetylmuramoyl-tripeptide--D-alanyl-D-alanine ligase [candidate division WOR-3 bacterium]
MEPIRLNELVTATGGRLVNGRDLKVTGVSIDTRTLTSGDLYVAIRGKRLDGHQFCEQAVAKGAVGVVVDSDTAVPKGSVGIVVENTTAALGRIAFRHRERMSARVVAVTGSNGKSTTKEILAAILAVKFKTLKPQGSFNNDIGVPLTVLRMTRETEAAVFELEMNELGGTARLARICRPEVGVVTNIGDTHLEFMKDRHGVAQEKAELLQALPEKGAAALNADDPMVMAIGSTYAPPRRVTFGLEEKSEVFATDIVDAGLAGSRFRLMGQHEITLPMPGRHNVANCLAACAGAYAMGMWPGDMPDAIARLEPLPMRLRVQKLGDITLIEDCYNANPQSVGAALKILEKCGPVERRVAFLGDMHELGESSAVRHEDLGREVGTFVSRLVAVGPMGEHTARGASTAGLKQVARFDRAEQARGAVFDFVRPGDTILVKGSRAMAMEIICQEIVRVYGERQ